ncbi:Cilia- and flagella-associated protein 52 [Phytophthora boehmeriae]|uniref:Cilia- and flagella-associated protein 52 n=1 Tax=Phytophthora boehmeriae TaxID=109152 RepID=A0A8T1X611_9STRA|nr:Cilia- and flagella-associated protein 52 [Phytophthora boehmeriae]
MADTRELKLRRVIGYNGTYPGTLIYTTDGRFLIYSLGLAVVVKDIKRNTQCFLRGHSDVITCLAISNDGTKLASGQQSKSRGNKAPVLVWDLAEATARLDASDGGADADHGDSDVTFRLVLHMGKVQALAFSARDSFLFTVGGQDDNALVCWNMTNGEPICGTPSGDDSTLVVTSFNREVNDELLVTGGNYNITVWRVDLKGRKFHALRANVGNLKRIVTCIGVSPDDKVAYCGTKTGDLLEVILDCDLTKPNCMFPPVASEWRLITGGKDGRVRVWRITPSRQTMEASLKEHRGPVNAIQVVQDCTACVSASSDGSCIVWNLETFVRTQAMFASTVFRRVLYHPDESQLLTCGSDRRITYFDAYDGEAIRFLEEAADHEILAMDIEQSGTLFATGGRDGLLRVWHYDNGETVAIGRGHSEAINAVKISPDRYEIVTVGSEGAIMIWEMDDLLEQAHG